MDIAQIKSSILELRNKARCFFETVEKYAEGAKWSLSMYKRDSWDLLEEEDKSNSAEAQKIMLSVIGPLIVLVKSSPLLNDADAIEIGKTAKAMRASLRLREFRSWDAELLHDEGNVLGVKPPGQSEEKTLYPTEAKDNFFKNLDRVDQLLELLEVSPLSLPTGLPPSNPKLLSTYRPNTAFIMMQIDPRKPELNDLYDTYNECFSKFGIKAIRADDIEHNGVITIRILDEIKTSEFLLGDLTGERPSVYYEVGYAHSLGRRVMLFRQSGTPIHFDLAAYNCPEYEALRGLRERVMKRLESMTGKKPEGA